MTDTPTLSATREVRWGVLLTRLTLIGAAVAGIVLEHGFYTQPVQTWVIHLVQACLFGLYALDLWLGQRVGRWSLLGTGTDGVDSALVGLGGVGMGLGTGSWLPGGWHVFELAAVVLMMTQLWRLNVALSRLFYRPGILFPLSFITMTVAGTLLLKVPLAVPAGQTISWTDALFTMTSAVCVTGLAVRDTATQFSPVGQAIIGVFIQLGGLGIIIFGSVLAMMLGSRLSLRENLSLSSMLNDQPLHRLASFVRFIVLTTLLLEVAGAAAMWPMWGGDISFKHRLGLSLFHSVSAFCNAGFSLQSDSLASYRYAPGVHIVILPLLVIGGLGFPVLDNLWQSARWRWRRSSQPGGFKPNTATHPARGRLSLHTKIVLCTTAALYLYGVAGLAAAQLMPYVDDYLQHGVTANRVAPEPLDARRVGEVLADASFMSLTARTAGFNTIPIDEVRPAGRFVLMTLMMIGASPGGTGGGMKTTTAALLLLTVVATLRRRDHTEAFRRQIGEELVRKAATLAACFIALTSGATLLLSLSEPYPFEKLAFEAVSAASTTGLSMGITSDLTAFGKGVIIATMFLGRVGPLAILGALLFRTRATRPYAYPHEQVAMG